MKARQPHCKACLSTGPRSRVSVFSAISWSEAGGSERDDGGERRQSEPERREGEKERGVILLSLCPRSLEFLGDTGGRIGIINYDLLQRQRLRSADYLTVMSARRNYIYISSVME